MKSTSQGDLYNLPNTLTGIRVASIPLVLVCLSLDGKTGSLLAALFFALAFVTDILDGFYARRHGTVTDMGKFLDPLADKILVCGTMIMLISLGRIPAWMVVVIVSRELAITGLRAVAVKEGIVIQASILGKYKTGSQAVALTFLCLHYTIWRVPFHTLGMAVFWVALGLTVWSGWDYFRQFYGVFLRRSRQG